MSPRREIAGRNEGVARPVPAASLRRTWLRESRCGHLPHQSMLSVVSFTEKYFITFAPHSQMDL